MRRDQKDRMLDRDPALREFYSSIQWRRCSEVVKREAGYVCQDCGGTYGPGNEVHHIQKISPENITDPNITLNKDNLVCLCRHCHIQRHKQMRSNRRYIVDPDTGDIKAT